MDEESSSPTFSTPTPAASASTSSQPTYTTAGTIYKPNSSQRLQPPTRRGRLLKAASDTSAHPFENSKFGYSRQPPDEQPDISALLRAKIVVAVDLPPRIPQQISYKPLQQNYDRAVSPLNNLAQELIMTLPAVPLFREAKDKGVAIDTSSSDDEDDTVTSALMNMTVKSLQNLASYPNPNQKSAQKALLRGKKPRAGSARGVPPRLGTPTRLGTPSIYRSDSPNGGGVPLREEMSNELRHTLSDPAALRQSYSMRRLRKTGRYIRSEATLYTDYHGMTESSRLSTPSIHSDNSDPNPSASMSLATSVGAPKPLTAGPPGQRQYRPSTFDSTFRALNTTPTAPQEPIIQVQEEGDYHLISSLEEMTKTTPVISPVYTGEDEGYIPDLHLSSGPAPVTPTAYQDSTGKDEEILSATNDTLLNLTVNSDPEAPLGTDKLARSATASKWFPYYGTCSNGGADVYYFPQVEGEDYLGPVNSFTLGTATAPSLSELWSSYDNNEFCEPTTPMFPQSMGYAVHLTEAEIQERNLRLNIHWYAGTGLLGDAYPLPKPIVEDIYPPAAKNIYGAVGDGRPTQDSSAGRGGDEWPVRSMSSTPGNSSIVNGLALLGEVLSRAIDAV